MDSILRSKAYKLITQFAEGEKKNIHRASRDSTMTYSHAFKLVKYWETKGILLLEKQGREQIVSLTNNGIQLKKNILSIMRLLR